MVYNSNSFDNKQGSQDQTKHQTKRENVQKKLEENHKPEKNSSFEAWPTGRRTKQCIDWIRICHWNLRSKIQMSTPSYSSRKIIFPL